MSSIKVEKDTHLSFGRKPSGPQTFGRHIGLCISTATVPNKFTKFLKVILTFLSPLQLSLQSWPSYLGSDLWSWKLTIEPKKIESKNKLQFMKKTFLFTKQQTELRTDVLFWNAWLTILKGRQAILYNMIRIHKTS